MTDLQEKLAYSIAEAAAMTGISRRSLYRLFDAGDIKPRKAGGRTVILRSDLEECLKSLPIGVAKQTGGRRRSPS